jgi:CBS domain-containing protein
METETLQTKPLIGIRQSLPIKQAAELMSDMSIGALGAHDRENRFVGVLTERDLLWATGCGKDPYTTTVAEIMNDLPVVEDGPLTPQAAADRMISAHVRHLIVREDDEFRLISMRDVLKDCVPSGSKSDAHLASQAEMRRWFALKPI